MNDPLLLIMECHWTIQNGLIGPNVGDEGWEALKQFLGRRTRITIEEIPDEVLPTFEV